jgi:hypothetical protein
MAEHKFTAEQWMNRKDRSREPLFSFRDFTSMFGMTEMESGVADICNKAKSERCKLRDVRFTRADLTSDRDAFRELLHYGWIIECGGQYRLKAEAVHRVHKRHPHL